MPSRELLSDAQRQRLLTAHYALDPRMMVRYWTLSADDLKRIRSRRGDENRLGFAVQLCLLRFPGIALKPQDEAPNQLVRFVAEQLYLEPASADAYAVRDTTRRQHLSICGGSMGSAATDEMSRSSWQSGCCQLL
jgi:TnpA family transposase